MRKFTIPAWKEAPFLRLLLPVIVGILLQVQSRLPFYLTCCMLLFSVLLLLVTSRFRLYLKYRYRALQGISIHLLYIAIGSLLAYSNSITNHTTWFGNVYKDSSAFTAYLTDEPIVTERYIKATLSVKSVFSDNRMIPTSGKAMLYLKNDSISELRYGDVLLIKSPLQIIRNTGNPGSFDYKRYSELKGITHSVSLQGGEYCIIGNEGLYLKKFILGTRNNIIEILRHWLSSKKSIIGIAEALLIGYKADLDADLLQAYSNTGVVHIIAISGLHLGLIYFVLNWLISRAPLLRNSRFLKTLIVLGSLWLFALLTGGSASVLRSAVMFTCILIGSSYFRKTSIYNSLASSAFILLCYDPFYIWDAGFLLSYLAVGGIVWLQQPLYKSVYFKLPAFRKVWSLISVTLAAQLAAFPLCLYYFHQFPNYFLITNLIAVPLSTVILFTGVFLLCICWFSPVAALIGKVMSFLIGIMNRLITACSQFPYAVWDNIYATINTTIFLYGAIFFLCLFAIQRRMFMLWGSVLLLIAFGTTHLVSVISSSQQKKIVVFNVARQSMMQLIEANNYWLLGDTITPDAEKKHIRPSNIYYRLSFGKEQYGHGKLLMFCGYSILRIDTAVQFQPLQEPKPVAFLILSHNARIKIADLIHTIKPAVIIFDSSNSLWKIAGWKKECTSLLLQFHSVPEQGAFISDLK